MRKLLGTLVIFVAIVGAIGFFRGWFDISTTDEPGNTNIELKIDTDRIKQDAATAKDKAREFTSSSDSDAADQPVSEVSTDEGQDLILPPK